MMRAVLDANVIVSGAVRFRSSDSPPGLLLQLWLDDQFELCLSAPLLSEVERTLDISWFRERVAEEDRQVIFNSLIALATFIEISDVVSGVATHPEDDLILATAATAQAMFLVTGDRQLLAIQRFQQVEIISPRDFLKILQGSGGSPS